MFIRLTILVAAVLAAGTLTACESREQRCTKAGGTVTSEREYDAKKKRWVTEYECMVGPDEIDEWKV